MAIKVSKLVWDQLNLGTSEKLVLLWMAYQCDNTGGNLSPSIRTLARDCCMSEKQARRHVNSLIDGSYLEALSGAPGTTRQYHLRLERLKRDAPASPPSTPPQSIRRTYGR